MTQENKELLLNDLCSRLVYGVKCRVKNNHKISGDLIGIVGENVYIYSSGHAIFNINDIKPYLFPLSSMTDEQQINLTKFVANGIHGENILYDWYNKNHFDYRGLIEKGLAIDATNLNIY